MSKTVSFKCDESSTDLFVKILNRLSVAGERNQTRKIRIGGDEYEYVGGVDSVTDVSVDGKKLSDMTPQEEQELETLRSNALPSAVVNNVVTPPPAPASISAQTSVGTVSVPQTSDSDDGDDEDDDLLNSDEAIAVKDVVAGRVSQGAMFTAFDVTKELRGKGNQVQHRNIKEIVHALYTHGEMSGYDRSLVSISGAPIQPFLYHPTSCDPTTYQP